jgi:hypothetical protein
MPQPPSAPQGDRLPDVPGADPKQQPSQVRQKDPFSVH